MTYAYVFSGRKKIVICAALAFVVSFVYAGMTSRNLMQTPAENKPGHHTAAGFQNYPFVETAAPKGVLFYLRRFWHSIFLPEVQDGHVLPATDAMSLLNAIDGDSVTWLGHASFLMGDDQFIGRTSLGTAKTVQKSRA